MRRGEVRVSKGHVLHDTPHADGEGRATNTTQRKLISRRALHHTPFQFLILSTEIFRSLGYRPFSI